MREKGLTPYVRALSFYTALSAYVVVLASHHLLEPRTTVCSHAVLIPYSDIHSNVINEIKLKNLIQFSSVQIQVISCELDMKCSSIIKY